MIYCKEIQTTLEAADIIRISNEKYQGEVRMQKYKILAIANHFSGKKIKVDLGRFNERQCKPHLNETDITVLTAEVDSAIKDLQKVQNEYNAQLSKSVPVSVKELEALEFLKNNPMAIIREQYFRLHYGDEDALSTVLWGYCIKWVNVAQDEGVHVIAIGIRGSGKSHGIITAMGFLPPELAWIKGITAQYIYYAENLVRGLTIYLDDLPSDPALIDTLKAIITAYPTGGSRGSVQNGMAREQSVPARITINTSATDQKADEQFVNRMTVIRSSSDKENRRKRTSFRIQLYEGKIPHVDKNTLAKIHNALRYISTKTFTVIVPEGAIDYDKDVEIDTRVLNQFFCAIMGNAILNFPNRNPIQKGDNEIHITVSKEDFDAVIHLYQDPNEYLLKLTPAAILIKNHLEKNYPNTENIGGIAEAVGLSTQTVRTSIKGRIDRHTESLINAGYVEEVSLTDQGVETRWNSASGTEYAVPTGPRLTSKVYRATQSASAIIPSKKKNSETGQIDLSAIVGMVYWNQEKLDERSEQPKQTIANQPLVCSNLPLISTITNQTNQKGSGGVRE